MEHSIALSSLNPREAVADALHRCIIGMDDSNREMFESAILKSNDGIFGTGNNAIRGWDALREHIYNKIMPLSTTHFVTNIRVDLKDGADTASLTAHALAYHFKPEDAFKPEGKPFTSAGLYIIDLVKDNTDGLWKIKSWISKRIWSEGESSVITG
jgi:SnoaL-like domain